MIKYGFELEGFAVGANNEIIIPPETWPIDGFPGLVELRSVGGSTLIDAYSQIIKQYLGLSDKAGFLLVHEHKFSGKILAELRRNRHFAKEQLDVQNLYGKEPRNLNGRTLASLQINISNRIAEERTDQHIEDKRIQTTFHVARYGLLDVANIVRRLDKTFEKEIKSSGRQPGMYSIKDTYRLEYRSLPNTVFELNPHSDQDIIERIQKAVEG